MANKTVNTVANTTSQAAGPGGIAILANINMGVAGGNNEIALENTLDGESRIGPKHIIGIMTNNITGVIKLCASRISEHAAPIAEKIDPKITREKKKKKTNHTYSETGTSAAIPK